MFKFIALQLFNGIKGMMLTQIQFYFVCVRFYGCLFYKFLQHIGGINESSFVKVLNSDIDRTPKENLEFYHQFIEEFNTTLLKLETNNKEVILAGDFNIDLLKLNEKNILSEYFDMITSNSFYPKITVPTRLINNHGTLIDNFLCKLSENTLDTTSGVLTKKLSDHQPYFIVLNNVLIKDSPPVYVKINKQDNQAIQNFHNEIITSDKLINLKYNINEDPNNTYTILHNVIQDAKTNTCLLH